MTVSIIVACALIEYIKDRWRRYPRIGCPGSEVLKAIGLRRVVSTELEP